MHTATVSFGRSAGGKVPVDALIDSLIAFISDQDNPAGLVVLGAVAMVEYLFPPFPGDTITLFGAVMISAYGWSFSAVLGAVLLGSMAGSMLVFYLGSWLQKRRARDPQGRATLDWLVQRFHRYGAAWLVVNRFLPGIRSLFFVAAGMAGMRAPVVLFYSMLSSLLWNLGLIALGVALGANLDTLLGWVRRYNIGVWSLLVAVAGVLVIRMLWRRIRRRTDRQEPEDAVSPEP